MHSISQNSILTYQEAQKNLNTRLANLLITNIQNGMSDTKRLFFTIFSKKYNADYSLSVGTEKWVWRDASGKEIQMLTSQLDDSHFYALTAEAQTILLNKPTILKIELAEKPKTLQIHFTNGSVFEAQEDPDSQEASYFQLRLAPNAMNKNYDLQTEGGSWKEKIA